MQSSIFKNILLTLLLSAAGLSSLCAQSLTYHLAKADSLFEQKRYTQSLELYQSIFAQKQYTPAMLLKMAFIEEGLNHPSLALYYLNLHYQATRNEHVLSKIIDFASKEGLNGYEVSDTDRLLATYDEYHTNITGTLAAGILLVMSLIIFQRTRKVKPVGSWIGLVFLLVLLSFHNNFNGYRPSAIIMKPNTYVMNGPSAGASVVGIIQEGNCVKVLDKNDVWMKVKLNNRDVYIKESNLWLLSI